MRLCKPETGADSSLADLPYLPTTLPQEKATVTITPVHQRVTECKLVPMERPRVSTGQRKPRGTLEQLGRSQSTVDKKLTVKLPQDQASTGATGPAGRDMVLLFATIPPFQIQIGKF